MKKQFKEVVCISGGVIGDKTFQIGEIYPICGCNNGLQLVYEDKNYDAQVLFLFSYSDEFGTFQMPADENENVKFISISEEE